VRPFGLIAAVTPRKFDDVLLDITMIYRPQPYYIHFFVMKNRDLEARLNFPLITYGLIDQVLSSFINTISSPINQLRIVFALTF
jgi:hypothetical protein